MKAITLAGGAFISLAGAIVIAGPSHQPPQGNVPAFDTPAITPVVPSPPAPAPTLAPPMFTRHPDPTNDCDNDGCYENGHGPNGSRPPMDSDNDPGTPPGAITQFKDCPKGNWYDGFCHIQII